MEENEKTKSHNKLLIDKKVLVSGIIGLCIGILIIFLIAIIFDFAATRKINRIKRNGEVLLSNNKDAVALIDGGEITQTDLYNDMKKFYNIESLLDMIDSRILNEKYTLTDEKEKELNAQADSILEQYSSYYGNDSQEQFLKANGFSSREDFVDYLVLEYKRNKYYADYLKTIISQKEVEDYYNSNSIYGDIKAKLLFVSKSDNSINIANEIIEKLNSGKSFDDVVKEYENTAVYQEITLKSLEEEDIEAAYSHNFIEAIKALEKNMYTKEAVETDYGYFVIYCTDKKDNPSIEEAEEDILIKLAKNNDSLSLKFKALIKLREEANLQITDEKLADDYKLYCENNNQ